MLGLFKWILLIKNIKKVPRYDLHKQFKAVIVGCESCVTHTVSVPLRISPSSSTLLSGMPWQMTSLTDVQQDLGKL